MIQDRGSKKWVSLMLPEHKKLLGKFYQDQNNVTMPALDDQRLEEINETVQIALGSSRTVTIIYHRNKRHLQTTGVIKACDQLKGNIILNNMDEGEPAVVIPFAAVIQVQLA
jgi:hypothetical protein